VAPSLATRGVECLRTTGPRNATALACDAVARGAERVIAVGGDGTVSEVAAGLLGSSISLAVIPAGRGNDFARALGIPRGRAAAARLALEGHARDIDVGCATSSTARRTFVNVAGCGFDAEVVHHMAQTRNGTGSLAYLMAVLGTLARVRPRHLRLTLDGGCPLERSVVGLAVANGTHYGGGLRIAPRAALDDGLFDVCVVGARTPAGVLALLPWLYVGAHTQRHGVEFFRARHVIIEPLDADSAGCQADGEPIGGLPAAFEVQPAALRVITGLR
jgi:diacylglycerol kinase (ATP)